ncbi:MAG: hypothetical protein MJ244_05150 [Clostridia bacterium]|nr:hypothetical protein [Clostridia bacterium]
MIISEYVKQPIDFLNSTALAEDLAKTTSYYYTCASALSDREEEYAKALSKAIQECELEDISAKAKEIKARSLCSDKKRDVDSASWLLKALELRHKTLITLISKAKEEMKLSTTQGG